MSHPPAADPSDPAPNKGVGRVAMPAVCSFSMIALRGIGAAVEQHIELMLESRLREAIAPALARAADQLTRDLREPLAADLRDVVKRAVAQELARQGRV